MDTKSLQIIERIINSISNLSSFISILLVLPFIKTKHYLYFFTLIIAAIIIHIILKMLIKEPRPPEYYETPSTYPEWMEDTFNKYGMPSGHSQVIGFLSSFIWFYTNNKPLLMSNIILSVITMYQRVAIKRHTLKQVIYGYSIGWILGYYLSL